MEKKLMINFFYNPIFLTRLLKSYLTDVDRIWRLNHEKLRKYQDKSFRKIIKYAYTVPVYNKKYKKYGINPNDVKGISDIKKLPLITKNDLMGNYPNGIISKNFNKKNAFLLSTSGSTGKPIFIYYDIFSAIKFTEGYMRSLKMLGGSWNKSKICLIVDMKPGGVEHASYQESLIPFLKKFISLDNIKYIHVAEKVNKILKELKEFNPQFLGSDPNMLRELAYRKNIGEADNINPEYLFSGGAILDSYSRKYVEKSFRTKILDNYGTTEGGPMAFQCMNENGYHVNSDFIFMEFLDKNGSEVGYNTSGRIVITRLYGNDTPIIRYTGLDDIVTPVKSKDCCGITTIQMIKNIEGRSMEFIRLPDGSTIAPFNVTTIPASVMDDLNTYKIKQFQIIQNKINEIEVLIIIDDKLRNVGPSVEKIIKELEIRFKKIIGSDVNIIFKEVKNIEKDIRSDHVKLVVSKIKQK
jgi:phenylacetate-CoA ligase